MGGLGEQQASWRACPFPDVPSVVVAVSVAVAVEVDLWLGRCEFQAGPGRAAPSSGTAAVPDAGHGAGFGEGQGPRAAATLGFTAFTPTARVEVAQCRRERCQFFPAANKEAPKVGETMN